MNIINTSADIPSFFSEGNFDFEKWKTYMDVHVPGAKALCLHDMEDCIKIGHSWQDDFLPVLNLVAADRPRFEKTVETFQKITDGLDARIIEVFGKTVDTDVILYLGLCNGAGWVTAVDGKTTVLLGIEKIMELNWCNTDDMNGLILHELGHAYHAQYGLFKCDIDSPRDGFIWQLFTEGVAMVFEQEVVGNSEYFHQDKNDWKNWCDENAEHIKCTFDSDLNSMTRENQRYFGDWVSFEGRSDVGYYLGTLFVRYLLRSACFDEVIKYDIHKVKHEYEAFIVT